jgi:hypothetical protein
VYVVRDPGWVHHVSFRVVCIKVLVQLDDRRRCTYLHDHRVVTRTRKCGSAHNYVRLDDILPESWPFGESSGLQKVPNQTPEAR